ncbi:acetolactate synthase large subunit [Nocardia sp. NPDC004711]
MVPAQRPEPVTGAQAVVRMLEYLNVECVFGMPVGAILPLYDPLCESTIRQVLVRHEQGAGHAATGYAQSTGRVGVCVASSGPAATNLVTPLADAQMDSVPVVAITGQVDRAMLGTDTFGQVDICTMATPVTKHTFLVTFADEIAWTIAEAFRIASSGRPGAVLVDIPKDVLHDTTLFCWPPKLPSPTPGRHAQRPTGKLRVAATLIRDAAAPVLYVGGGVIKAEACQELRELAELTGSPVVTTLMARGAFPDSHPLHYGMPGMHGTVAAVAALQKSDLIVALGARFDDRVTGRIDSFAPHAKVIHVDIDPAEINKNRRADVPIVSDCKTAITELITLVGNDGSRRGNLTAWRTYLGTLRARYALSYSRPHDGMLSPEYVIEAVGQAAGPEAIFVSGVGQHQMWASQFIRHENPRHWVNSGGLGTMGFAIPAALGAKIGAPNREVWAVDGDGCFQMTYQELATAAVEGIPIKIALINNGNLGMVRQLQTLFYAEKHTSVDLATHTQCIPDFVALAQAHGCVGLRCTREEDVTDVIARARAINDRPVVIDFVVSPEALVWPMIAAGASNDEIMAARDIRPLFDDEEPSPSNPG